MIITMALLTQSIKGTQDTLPAKSYQNQYMEQSMLEIARNFGYHEIRTPVFEHTELFQRSVGDTTDVVQKEMYTFDDKGGRSITLRPEGTAGAVRAFLEHGLHNEALPQKVCYLTSATDMKSRRQAGCANSINLAWNASARLLQRRMRRSSPWHPTSSIISALNTCIWN